MTKNDLLNLPKEIILRLHITEQENGTFHVDSVLTPDTPDAVASLAMAIMSNPVLLDAAALALESKMCEDKQTTQENENKPIN